MEKVNNIDKQLIKIQKTSTKRQKYDVLTSFFLHKNLPMALHKSWAPQPNINHDTTHVKTPEKGNEKSSYES